MRIAYFSPLSPQKSGIASYSAIILPSLAEIAEVDVFVDDALLPQLPPHPSIAIYPISSFHGPLDRRHHMCVYQMGANVRYHDNIFRLLRRYPGIVVLHDLNMNSFFGELYLMRGQVSEYTRLMAYAYHEEGLSHARSAHRGDTPYNIAKYPLFEPLVARSLGVIVHSHYAKSLILKRCPTTLVRQIPLVTDVAITPVDAESAKLQLGFEPSDLIVAAFGYMSRAKRLGKLLTAASKLRNTFPQLKLAFVGEVVDEYDLFSEIADLGLEDITRVTGYVEESILHTYLSATDVGFNLRYPTIGESSATLAALMVSAKPSLVSSVDAFAEYPDGTCIKIDVGEDEELQIEAVLNQLLNSAELRRQIGHNARRFIEFTSAPSIVAREYAAFIEAVVNGVVSSETVPNL
jgi:glycosyltransferase involved in cell wall biosynthesis